MKRRGGRPPIGEDRADVRVAIRVSRQSWAALRDVATLNQQTRTAFIRQAIEEAVADCTEQRVFPRRR
jgi:uncharacterized protein (DUF1778 family)